MEEQDWVIDELGLAKLGDKRRTERLIEITKALAKKPSSSIPLAMEDKASLKAAYRFFDNDDIEENAILKSHVQSTYQRINQAKIILAPQDTTYIDLTSHPETEGIGLLGTKNQYGLLAHSTILLTPERVPLGVLQQQVWMRDPETYGKLEDHKQRAIEDKESKKWLVSLESVNAAAKENPETQFISIGDREADVYDLFLVIREPNVDLLIRATNNRRVLGDETSRIWSSVKAEPAVAKVEIQASRQKERPERKVELEVRYKKVIIRPPQRRTKEMLPNIPIWVVNATEINPTSTDSKIEWMLICTKEINSAQDALNYLDWYCSRWEIEIWHKILKSGCRIEARQLKSADRIKRLLAIFSVIAWRILYVTMLNRVMPDEPCTLYFENDEWQALFCAFHKTNLIPKEIPSMHEAVYMVASLGGFIGRRQDGVPGVTVLWRGFQRLSDLTFMYKIMRPSDNCG